MSRISAIFLFVTLSGCGQLPAGMGLFYITGNLANHSNERCAIGVSNNSQSFRRLSRLRPVFEIFQEQYRVSERNSEYRIEIYCDDQEIHQRIVTYPGTLGYGGTVALGLLL